MEKSLKGRAYDLVKQRIVSGVYPPGHMLNEKEIIGELGISRTPFRDAVNVLAEEGLVNIVPRRGMYVAEITVKDIVDMYGIRDMLEPFALGLAMKNKLPKEMLLRLQKQVEIAGKNYERVIQDDETLHALIIRYANNAYLQRMLESLYLHGRRVRIVSGGDDGDTNDINLEHIMMIESMLEGDIGQAQSQMKQHIANAKRRAFSRILETGELSIR
ncbi:GntR family transcriptional regulator [Christensenellaceae bacterium OttesenSCG-928-K19]|nr:GntR family transcriptional regulator [Christensenellaceae bacterium OttesenSCG-928-K19]